MEAVSVDLGAARLERAHEVGGLGRDVEAGRDAQAFERPLALEALADEAQHGHLPLGPLDAADALVREAKVGDVMRRGVRRSGRGRRHRRWAASGGREREGRGSVIKSSVGRER